MKFLLILAPLALYGVFMSVRSGGESEIPGETGSSYDEEVAKLSETVIHQDSKIPVVSSLKEFELAGSNENTILTEFNSSEQFTNQEFDFPEREFPDAPSYYSSANAVE